MVLDCGVGEDSLESLGLMRNKKLKKKKKKESLGLQGDLNSPS